MRLASLGVIVRLASLGVIASLGATLWLGCAPSGTAPAPSISTTATRSVRRPLWLQIAGDAEPGVVPVLGGATGTTDLYADFGVLPSTLLRVDLLVDPAEGAEPAELDFFAAALEPAPTGTSQPRLLRRLELGRRRVIPGVTLRFDVTDLALHESSDGRFALVARGHAGTRVVLESLRLDVYTRD